MKNARVDESGTKLTALEEFLRISKKQVVGVQHDNSLVLRQFPGIYLIQGEHKACIKIVLVSVRVTNIINHHYLHTFVVPAMDRGSLDFVSYLCICILDGEVSRQ